MSAFVCELPDELVADVVEIVDIVCYGRQPIEITENQLHMVTDVWLWLGDNNIDDYEWDHKEGVIVFRRKQDYLLFKLTWL